MSDEHVLIVGGTGRTGRRLVQKLCDDPRISCVTAICRDPVKAQLVFGPEHDNERLDGKINIVEGDLTDVGAWSSQLEGVSQVVTAVSCGMSTDPLVVLGAKEPASPLPSEVDGDGIAQLAHAAKAHGVRRFVAVTTASAGSPWSMAALFLNLIHHGSVKEKWRGEQAIRSSGLDYVIIRPYGLGKDGLPPPGVRGIEWTQGRETAGGSSRRIHREDVATLCHEALLCDPSSATASRATFECWSTTDHARPMEWSALKPDPPGALPEVDHATAMGVALASSALLGAASLRVRTLPRMWAMIATKPGMDAADRAFFGGPKGAALAATVFGIGYWKTSKDRERAARGETVYKTGKDGRVHVVRMDEED